MNDEIMKFVSTLKLFSCLLKIVIKLKKKLIYYTNYHMCSFFHLSKFVRFLIFIVGVFLKKLGVLKSL